ncbi:MAG: DMT family transporter [Bacteroidales bacterium]|nr:DMT family transporter [Bacteroidales bacterium]
MKKNTQKYLVYPLLILAMLFWAYSFIWAKFALDYYHPISLIFFRTVISFVFLFFVLLIAKKQLRIKLKDLPIFILLAFFEPFLYFLGETNGLNRIDASTTAVIISTIPLFTPIVAYYFLKERFSLFNILGILISILGVIVIVFNVKMEILVSTEGLAFLFLAVVAALGFSVVVKRIPENYSVFTVIFYQNLIGAFLFLPLVLIFNLNEIIETGFVKEAVLPIIKLGVFASSLAFMFYINALRYMNISKANIFTNMIPVFTIIISWYVLGEAIDTKKILGIIFVLSGVFISQIGSKKASIK